MPQIKQSRLCHLSLPAITTRGKLIIILIALTFIGCMGCKNPVETPAVSAGESAGTASSGKGVREGASTASSSGSTSATRKEYVTDPTLNNMNAYSVTIPAKWHFQGVLYQGGNCASVPFGVFRATSPDGLSYVERMPALGWVWGTGPMLTYMPKNDCLPLKGPMSAQQFLKYLAATMKVDYVGPELEPAEEDAKAQQALRDAQAVYAPKYAAMNTQPPKTTRELARATVSYKNGTFPMRGRLKVMVECMETVYPGMKSVLRGIADRPSSTVDKCTAGVTYYTAPESQYQAMIRQWDAPGMGGKAEDAWQQAWVQRNSEQSQQMISQMNRNAAAQRQASAQQFSHDQAVRQQMHEQFMATMQRGTDMSMARTQASMNARSTSTSDWVDYALDRKTVLDPTTGQVSKVSSSYTHTWIDSTGKTSFQTNDINANPNGVLPGNWTQQQVVHGDGSQ
jgi:hypothetical protein